MVKNRDLMYYYNIEYDYCIMYPIGDPQILHKLKLKCKAYTYTLTMDAISKWNGVGHGLLHCLYQTAHSNC